MKTIVFRVGLEKDPGYIVKEKILVSLKEAEDYYEKLDNEIGFHKFIDKVEIEDLEIDIEDYLYLNKPYKIERIKEGNDYLGKVLEPNGIVVTYSHETHLNYAYKIWEINYVKNTRLYNEGDLIFERPGVYRPMFVYFQSISELIDDYKKKIGVFAKVCGGEDLIKDFIQNFQNK